MFNNPYKIALKKLEEASKNNVPVVLILRADGTADWKLPQHVMDNIIVIRDRGNTHVIPFEPRDIYTLPGGLQILVVEESTWVVARKSAWAYIFKDEESLKEAVVDLARRAGANSEELERIRGMSKEDLVSLAIQLGNYVPSDVRAMYEIIAPHSYMNAMKKYYEAKTVTFMAQVLNLKLSYERNWVALLAKILPIILLLIVLLVVSQQILPVILKAFSTTAPPNLHG